MRNTSLAMLALALSSLAPAAAQSISDQEAYEVAKDAYVYAYPLVLPDGGSNHELCRAHRNPNSGIV
jgi:hypothetical protein